MLLLAVLVLKLAFLIEGIWACAKMTPEHGTTVRISQQQMTPDPEPPATTPDPPKRIESTVCSPPNPDKSVGVIVNTPTNITAGEEEDSDPDHVEIKRDASRLIGSCPCGDGDNLVELFFTPLEDPSIVIDPHAVPTPLGSVLTAHCQKNHSQFCLCDQSGICYQELGNATLSQVQLYPYCDEDGCYAYTVPLCADPAAAGKGGLTSVGEAGEVATNFTCADVFDVDGVPMELGSNSSYIKAMSISCSGGCGASDQLGRSTSGCRAPFTPSDCVLPETQPRAAPFVLDIADSQQRGHLPDLSIGTCPCASGQLKESFFSSLPSPHVDHQLPNAMARCNDMGLLCTCSEEQNKCYRAINATSSTSALSEVQFYSYCEPDGECHIYAVPVCNTPDSSEGGLEAIDGGGERFLCSDAFYSDGELKLQRPLGTNSTYIKAHSVSCSECVRIEAAGFSTCTGPFVPSGRIRRDEMANKANRSQLEFIRRVAKA